MNMIKLNEKCDNGELKISNDVLAVIAGAAANEVEGVVPPVASKNGITQLINKVGINKGIDIEVVDNVVSVEIEVVVKFGYNIREVSEKVQEKIAYTLETMTGFEMGAIDINVVQVAN